MKHLHTFTSHRERNRRYFATYRIGGDDLRRIEAHIEVATPRKGTWLRAAVAGTVDLVKRDRRHYQYVPPARSMDGAS